MCKRPLGSVSTTPKLTPAQARSIDFQMRKRLAAARDALAARAVKQPVKRRGALVRPAAFPLER